MSWTRPTSLLFESTAPSLAKPAKFLVFFVKDKGAPVLVPTN